MKNSSGKIYIATLGTDGTATTTPAQQGDQTKLNVQDGEITVEEKTDEEKVETLLQQGSRDLYELSSVFPFDFFPNRIKIDENKVDLIYGIFLAADHIVSIFLKDIKVVRVTTGLLFANMDFEIEGYNENPAPIQFLPKAQALKARRIMMGLAALMNEEVDLSKFEVNELIEKTEKIGMTKDNVEKAG